MLVIHVDEYEFYDGVNEVFFYTKAQDVKLEHSLISISKWEANFGKPYLPSHLNEGMSGYHEELHYIECMIIGTVPEYIPRLILQNHKKEVVDYIASPNTATKIYRLGDAPKSRQTVTSELIYYWMIKFGIPFECEKWHFNRLLTLIDVCNVKENSDKNKMSTMDSAKYRYHLNRARRAAAQ